MNELSNTGKSIIDLELVDEIINNISDKDAANWWENVKFIIDGMPVGHLMSILHNAKLSKEALLTHYEYLMRDLSWNERIEIMQQTAKDLGETQNVKYKNLAVLAEVMSVSTKVLPIILTVL